uniref:Immunoglobulin lambda variable 11-55 (non-functional) n=1 Tax=Anolis carolinensis TaxID=28377 RepID=A0A803U1C9_ANOCA
STCTHRSTPAKLHRVSSNVTISFLASSPGTDSQPVLSQPPLASVSLESTVKLSCAWSSGFLVTGYHMSWYQQKPGHSNKGQGASVPSRFSGSKDPSSNTGYLTITGVLTEDEADYYCGTRSVQHHFMF